MKLGHIGDKHLFRFWKFQMLIICTYSRCSVHTSIFSFRLKYLIIARIFIIMQSSLIELFEIFIIFGILKVCCELSKVYMPALFWLTLPTFTEIKYRCWLHLVAHGTSLFFVLKLQNQIWHYYMTSHSSWPKVIHNIMSPRITQACTLKKVQYC